jgi:general secretion pathway protein D
MKKLFVSCLLAASVSLVVQAQPVPPVAPVKFDFQAVSVSQVVQLVYGDVLKQPYVIDPGVLNDQRLVSFRFDSAKGNVRQFWTSFLDSLGFVVDSRGGVDFIGLKKADLQKVQPSEFVIYRPRFRSVSYLVDLLASLFKPGSFSVQRAVKTTPGEPVPTNAPPSSAAGQVQTDADTLIFSGTETEVASLNKLLSQVDVAVGEVFVRAALFEVSTGTEDASGFSLALNLLGGKFGLTLGGSAALANSATIKTSTIEAVFGLLGGDSHFKALSSPRLRVKSGTSARLMVGQDVPTIGAVTYPQGGGSPVQSVEYRSAGVIFGLTPTVRDTSIDLVVDQQISDFAKTESGVNNSPTLSKRSLTTTVGLADGEIVLLGGLTSQKQVDSSSGPSWLPKVLHNSSRTDTQTEVLLLLQVERVKAESVAAR